MENILAVGVDIPAAGKGNQVVEDNLDIHREVEPLFSIRKRQFNLI